MSDILDENELYLAIIDNASEGIYCVDENRNIFFWNKTAEKISGYKAEEILSKSCAQSYLHHTDKNGKSLCDGFCPLVGTMFDGLEREDRIYLVHKDGRRVAIHMRAYPLYKDGKSIGAIEYFHEIDSSQSN